MDPSPEEAERRQQWFAWYVGQMASNSVTAAGTGPYVCPCCGHQTLDERGGYEICPVCLWEDDGQDDHDASVVRGGPNGELSLSEARTNYREFGACDRRLVGNVRPPRVEEFTIERSKPSP